MITRYTRPEMGELWSQEERFRCLLDVELAVAQAQAKLKIIPEKAYRDLKSKAKFSVKRIDEIEKTTKHDVIAFVSNVAENVGPSGRYLHYGMTSSDLGDTALCYQMTQATDILAADVRRIGDHRDHQFIALRGFGRAAGPAGAGVEQRLH